jgi:hypothetical protein
MERSFSTEASDALEHFEQNQNADETKYVKWLTLKFIVLLPTAAYVHI